MIVASARHREIVLVGDIGGSTARFATARVTPDRIELGDVASLRCADYSGFELAAESFLDGLSGTRPNRAAIAVAGPVTGDRVGLTNHSWSFSIEAARRRLGLNRLHLLNDFTAIAFALPRLGAGDLRQIGGGAPARDWPMAVIGPGTGLGTSALIPVAAHWIPLASEGGHVSFSPVTEREDRIAQVLRRRHGHVSWERILAGPGLVNLYTALAELDCLTMPPLPPDEIVNRALTGGCALCRESVEIFCAALGTAAGNLALTIGARGGVYVGGGIVPRLGEFFAGSGFRARFEAKGRMSDYLRAIPTCVITAAYPGLIGAAVSLRLKEGME